MDFLCILTVEDTPEGVVWERPVVYIWALSLCVLLALLLREYQSICARHPTCPLILPFVAPVEDLDLHFIISML